MVEDLTRLHTDQLMGRMIDAISPPRQATDLAVVMEAVRRLKMVDGCICWGVDCVHQAKELDKSYAEYVKKQCVAQEVWLIVGPDGTPRGIASDPTGIDPHGFRRVRYVLL
jgi:hypothetical protein